MSIVRAFFEDELGAVVSAELVMVGTVGVLAMTAGLSTVTKAVNDELCDLAKAIRSLDQSYEAKGWVTSSGYSATSKFTQRPVAESIAELACGVAGKNPSTVVESKPATSFDEVSTVIEFPVQILPGQEVDAGTITPADAVLNPQ